MLTLLLGALVAATPPPPPAEPEARVAHYVLQEFERVGRRAPQVDPALTQAARSLARRALEDSLAGAVEGSTLTQAVSDAGGADPTPRFYLVRAGERDHALQKILERKDLNQERATHMGVGVESQGPLTALVVLLAERKATLQRFPRVLDTAGTSRVLCGEFAGELRGAQVYVTLPDGRVERPSLTREVDASFCTRLLFTRPGEYTVEFVGRGERGPEVVALFLVDVETPPRRGGTARVEEPTTPEAARDAVLERI
ncbi:MAG: CAP domain-containing protein, partial [Cystobacter sp.]